MIYITGDTHGEHGRMRIIFSNSGISWTAADYIVICGDFGYVSTKNDTFLDEMDVLGATILFIDGNHENFDLLNSFPVEIWNGGKVHRVRKSIIHLMRSQVFKIDDTTIFTLGGGYSFDKYIRQENVSWWACEMPSPEEYDEAIENLIKHDNKVDYIITHTAPGETIAKLMLKDKKSLSVLHPKEQPLNTFFDYINDFISYKHWYFGHFHLDSYIWRNQTALSHSIIKLGDCGAEPYKSHDHKN